MLDVTVKTLDGKNRSFSVPDDITVQAFKDKISNSIDIPGESQRLIYQGKVLQDEKKLDYYDVNGKVIHVVQRPPPASRSGATSTTTSTSSTSRSRSTSQTRDGSRVVVGSFNLPVDLIDQTQVQNIVHQVVGGLGEAGRNARVSTRASSDGSSMDVHINLGHVGPPQLHSEAQARINNAKRMIKSAHDTLERIENPPSSPSGPDGVSSMDTSDGGASRSGTSTAESSPTRSNMASPRQQSPDRPEAGNTPQQPRHPMAPDLANLLEEVNALNRRLQPHMDRYHKLLEEDTNFEGNDDERRNAQRLSNLVSETLHYISHAYHSMSDLIIDMGRAPPRQVRAAVVTAIPASTAVIQQTIPVSAQINVSAQRQQRQTPSTNPQQTAPATTSTQSTATTSPQATPSTPPRSGSNLAGQPRPPFGSPIPHFMMEVGPSAVTIDSISAHVVGGANPGATPESTQNTTTTTTNTQASASTTTTPNVPRAATTTTPSSQPGGPHITFGSLPGNAPMFMPPDIMQNIIHMVHRAHVPGQVPGPSPNPSFMNPATSVSQASAPTSSATPASNSTPTTGTTGTGTNTTPSNQGARPRGHAFVIPGPQVTGLGMPGIPGMLQPVDQYLQCQSRHFLARRPVNTSNNATNMEQGLRGVVSNILTSIVGQQVATATAPASSTTSNASASTSTTPAASQPRPSPTATNGTQPSAPQVQAEPHFINALRDLLQQGGNNNSQTAPGGEGTAAGVGASDEVFAQLVRGIGTSVSEAAVGRAPQGTIADFMSMLGQNYNIANGEGQGIITDIFNCLSPHLTFVDLMGIFFGQPAPLSQVREPLQQFVREKVLEGEEATEQNKERAIEKLVENMQEDIDGACSDVRAKEGIDFKATLNEFARLNLRNLINMILAATDDLEFGRALYERITRVLHEFIALSCHCLEGGNSALETMVQGRVRNIAHDVNPLIQQWMLSVSAQQVQRIVPHVTVQESEIQHYVIRRSTAMENSPQSQSSEASFMSAESNVAQEVSSCGAEAMEVDAPPEGSNLSNGDLSTYPVGQVLNGAIRVPPPPSAELRDDVRVALGSEEWHSNVPREWVPVITRDISRQRRQGPQPPYSDTYLNGMPAKKRKLVMKEKCESNLAEASSAIPASVKQAVNTLGAGPVPSEESLMKDVTENTTLQTAYCQEMRNAIRQRIESDPDFIPEKYPQTEKLLKRK